MKRDDIRQTVLVLGAGKVGATVADMVAEHLGLPVRLADSAHPAGGPPDPLVERVLVDAGDPAALARSLGGCHAVVNALPFNFAAPVAAAASAQGVHYFDLTEDVAASAAIQALAAGATSLLMPHCGLAPGVIGMLGAQLAGRFPQELVELHLRVGALPRHVSSRLRYAFTWSIDGLINEYCNPCRAIVQGQPVWLPALDGQEALTLDGEAFEAFNTSGGLATLCDTLAGRVRTLDYKTLRHPGHGEVMRLLLHDLRLVERRDLLRQVLEHAVPHCRDDIVIVFASASGLRGGRLEQETRMARIEGGRLRGVQRTAIELATAAGVVGLLELLYAGRLPARGFVRQEQVALADLSATRAGRCYAALDDDAPRRPEHEREKSGHAVDAF